MLAFEDESYVRVYTRDTANWLRLGFEGQAVFLLLLRKVDRAGVLDGIADPVGDVALVTGAPVALVEVAMQRLLATGTLDWVSETDRLVVPRFVEAQSAVKSDRLRAAEARRRRRDFNRATVDTSRGATGALHGVTEASRGATDPSRDDQQRSDPSRSVTPSLADPSLADHGSPLPPPVDPPAALSAEPTRSASPRSAKGGKPVRGQRPCPDDFTPNDTDLQLAQDLGFTEALERRTRSEFVDYWRGVGKHRSDWHATYRNRLRTVAEARGLKPRQRDAQWAKYQQDLRKADAPPRNPGKPPAGFDANVRGLFG